MQLNDAISAGTAAFLTDRYPDEAEKWINDFEANVSALCDEWKFVPERFENNSRFGAIIYGNSEKYGQTVMKLIPWFCSRLKTEIACYELLRYNEMCPLYDVNTDIGALLLKYVPSDAKTPEISAVFSKLTPQRRRSDVEAEHAGIPRYERVLKEVTENALNEIKVRNDDAVSPLANSIIRARDTIKRFRSHDRFLIHGDIHRHNMLVSGNSVSIIDPLGYVAPYAFEYTRFLGTEIREFDMNADSMWTALMRMRADETGICDVMDALGVDTTLRACNTFIEGETYETILRGVRWAADAWRLCDMIQRQM